EVAKLFPLACGNRIALNIDAIKMIDQTFSPMRVELKPLVEVLLLEDNAIMNTGYFAARCRFTTADCVVISLFATGERRQQIMANRSDIELVQVATVRGRDERHQAVAGKSHLGPGVEIVIIRG